MSKLEYAEVKVCTRTLVVLWHLVLVAVEMFHPYMYSVRVFLPEANLVLVCILLRGQYMATPL